MKKQHNKLTGKNIIYQVDSFTDQPFRGNPAGVMIVDRETTSEWMQNIAQEMNLSETAFILPVEKNVFKIRYFTPLSEVPLCGHATLAGAHILFELELVKQGDTIQFKAQGADLEVNMDSSWIIMNFPEYPLKRIDIPDKFKEIVGFQPLEVYSSLYGWKVAVGKSEDIIAADPIFNKMEGNGLGFLMITAKSGFADSDFIVRCFGPKLGVNEDPATGSAHCALTPFWTEKLKKSELDSLQLSRRTGKLRVKMLNKNRVEIKGKAITVFEARLKIQ